MYTYCSGTHTVLQGCASQICRMMLYLIQFRFKAVYFEEQGVILQVLAILVTTVAEILLRDELLLCPTINR